MYYDYFGISESPFSITPDPRYLYMSKGHHEALAHLLYGVSENGGFVLLTGEVGTGKTSVCRCLLEQLPDAADVALILNPRLTELELLAAICGELGIAYPKKAASFKVMVDLLNRHLLEIHAKGRHAVVIIDEAQNLSPGVLEQVRLLTNLETPTRKLLQIVLIGQPELAEILKRKEMRQLAQRISAHYHLDPLSRSETLGYIHYRLAVGAGDQQHLRPEPAGRLCARPEDHRPQTGALGREGSFRISQADRPRALYEPEMASLAGGGRGGGTVVGGVHAHAVRPLRRNREPGAQRQRSALHRRGARDRHKQRLDAAVHTGSGPERRQACAHVGG
jgi:type II secretory pathway predicted ATPase ExeA